MRHEQLSDEIQELFTGNKVELEECTAKFPIAIDALSKFNEDRDIIAFYKDILKAEDPNIIAVLGTSGAGKTTFCQQFVDEEGKALINKTITPYGNSTIIQTDIAIIENTSSRLFLKARKKSHIIRDLILVALNIDSEFKFDIRKSINDVVNKAGVKRATYNEFKVSFEIFHGVYNLFRSIRLLEKFQLIAKHLQFNYRIVGELQNFIDDNLANENLTSLVDDVIALELKIKTFYGNLHEISLDQENILEKTIIPTKIFNNYKEQKEEFQNSISYRLLFEQAILVLKCDEKAKRCLPEKFKSGVVFRDSQCQKKSLEEAIKTDLEVKNRILLIPASTAGELVDDIYVEELKKIVLSAPKQSIVVITKLDKSSSYEKYSQNNYCAFIESLMEQIAATHNSLIGRFLEAQDCCEIQQYEFDKNSLAKMCIASFDNAYLSKITRDKQGNYDAELHKIVCRNKCGEEISACDIEDVNLIDNWHTLVSSIL